MNISVGIGGRTVDELVEQARGVVEQGFDSTWTANIFGLDAIVALAIVGREVPGLHVGTAVTPTYPRHPHALAQQAITAWDATGGRFTLGIGLSHQVVIESMFGLSFDKPAVHMREYLAVLLPLLRQGNVSFDGEQYKVNAPLDRIGPGDGPNVLLAAMAPVMLRLAGEVADGTILWMTGPKTIESHVAPRVNNAAADAGRPAPQIVASLPIAVTNDPDAARNSSHDIPDLRRPAVVPGHARPRRRGGSGGRRHRRRRRHRGRGRTSHGHCRRDRVQRVVLRRQRHAPSHNRTAPATTHVLGRGHNPSGYQ